MLKIFVPTFHKGIVAVKATGDCSRSEGEAGDFDTKEYVADNLGLVHWLLF